MSKKITNRIFCYKKLFLIVNILSIISCNSNHLPEVVKYFPNSKIIQSKGYYFNDTPVGTLTTFDSLGNISTIEQYDSMGLLYGRYVSFMSNGDTDQIRYYKMDKLNGITTSYKNNKITESAFFLNDKQVGNSYFYDSLGKCNFYNFLDFNGDGIIADDYEKDSFHSHRIFFLDSVISKEDKNDSSQWQIAFLISKPPNSSTDLFIEQLMDSVKPINKKYINIEEEYFIYTIKFPKNSELKITGNQTTQENKHKTLIQIWKPK